MHTFGIRVETFYTLSYRRLEEIVRMVYGKEYDTHEGLLQDRSLRTFSVVKQTPLSEYAQQELDKFLSEKQHHPNPLVLLTDMANRGDIPAGSYLI